jgi:DNA-binding SARP family transcriptional activator/DNA polymerase III delta prime subunit
VRINILGLVEVITSEEVDDGYLSQPLVRQAISVLAASPGTSLSSARLTELLWTDPDADINRLRTLMSVVRAVLTEDRVPRSDGTGYMLMLLRGDSTDAQYFADLHGRASYAAAQGDYAASVRFGQNAISLWRDARLSNFPATTAAQNIVRGLRDDLNAVRELVADGLLVLGRLEELIKSVRRWLVDDPLQEILWARLMLASYRAGLIGDALRAFEEARSAITRAVELEPSPMLVRMRDLISENVDPASELPKAWAPLAAEDARAGHAPAQLPPGIADFTGRTNESREISQHLIPQGERTATPVVHIVGPPGVGKTTLAHHVAHMVKDHFPDGQLYVELHGGSRSRGPQPPGRILGRLLRALGARGAEIPDGTDDRADYLRTRLAGRRVLIVADGASGPEQVRPLLPGDPRCAVIVTSRTRSTHVVGGQLVQLDRMSSGDAKDMLVSLVGQGRVDADPSAADAVVEACARLPLAVRIAAARLVARPTWSLQDLAAMLASRRDRLDNLRTGDLGVRASFAISYESLPSYVASVFRLLPHIGLHAFASWSVGALAPGVDPEAIIDVLVDKSLLADQGMDGAGQPRYALHDLIYDYAEELVEAEHDDRREAALETLTLGALELVDLADASILREPYAPTPQRLEKHVITSDRARRIVAAAPWRWLEAERLVLEEIARHACEIGRFRLAFGLTMRLAAYMYLDARYEEIQHLWRMLGHAAQDAGDERLAIEAQFGDAVVTGARRGRYAEAIPPLNICIDIATRRRDWHFLTRALALRALCRGMLNQYDDAEADGREGLKLALEAQDQRAESNCLCSLGLVLGYRGQHQEALDFCTRAAQIARQLDEPIYALAADEARCRVLIAMGRHSEALELAHSGCAEAVSNNYRYGIAAFTEQIGDSFVGVGKLEDGIDRLRKATELFREVGAEHASAHCQYKYAVAQHSAGRVAVANENLTACMSVFRRLGQTAYVRKIQQRLAETDG